MILLVLLSLLFSSPPAQEPPLPHPEPGVPALEQPSSRDVVLQARSSIETARDRLGEADYEGARQLVRGTLEILSRQALVQDSRALDEVRFAAARVAEALSLHSEAEGAARRSLAFREEHYPADHEQVLEALELRVRLTNRAWRPQEARDLCEDLLARLGQTLPEDHPRVLAARSDLATSMQALGDFDGARVLMESVLEGLARGDAPTSDLRRARATMARILSRSGDWAGALPLLRGIVESLSNRPAHDPDLCVQRLELAIALRNNKDAEGALAILDDLEQILARYGSMDGHFLHQVRTVLSGILMVKGEYAEARRVYRSAADWLSRTRGDEHPDSIVFALGLAWSSALLGEQEAGREHCKRLGGLLQAYADRAMVMESPRAIEAHLSSRMFAGWLHLFTGLASGAGFFEADDELHRMSFSLIESVRGAGVVNARLLRSAIDLPEVAAEVERLRAVHDAVSELGQRGNDPESLAATVRERDSTQRKLLELLGRRAATGLRVDPQVLARSLPPRAAAVGFLEYVRIEAAQPVEGEPRDTTPNIESLLAFVLRRDGALTRIELGPAEEITATVEAWRAAVLEGGDARRVRETGQALRRRVMDPLEPALAGVERLICALDGVLHTVPLDALPDESGTPLGERLSIEIRSSLAELTVEGAREQLGPPLLVAFGGIDYDAGSAGVTGLAPPPAGSVRSGAFEDGFPPLAETAPEVRAVAEAFEHAGTDEERLRVVSGSEATLSRLLDLAPSASHLHLATHGFFAPESPEEVLALSPMVLCGLALAGANAEPDDQGRIAGVVTAEQLAGLDLRRCELAVLSACDTNVGLRRAGQGVASLQKALHMAGAGSVVTSLWKVDDRAARRLMEAFYGGHLIEGLPKARALWRAKQELRAERFPVRDWAGWVLTGEAD